MAMWTRSKGHLAKSIPTKKTEITKNENKKTIFKPNRRGRKRKKNVPIPQKKATTVFNIVKPKEKEKCVQRDESDENDEIDVNDKSDDELFDVNKYETSDSLYSDELASTYLKKRRNRKKNSVQKNRKWIKERIEEEEDKNQTCSEEVFNEFFCENSRKEDIHYEIDFFSYLSSQNKEEEKDVAHFVLTELNIFNIFLKKRKKEEEKNDSKEEKKNNSTDVRNCKDVDTFLHRNTSNFKNIFYLENMKIDFSNKNMSVSPFNSVMIHEERGFINRRKTIKLNDNIIKKKRGRRRKSEIEASVVSVEKVIIENEYLFVGFEKKNLNSTTHIYINGICVGLCAEVIHFLYFIIVYNYLYVEEEEEEVIGSEEIIGNANSNFLIVNKINEKTKVENEYVEICLNKTMLLKRMETDLSRDIGLGNVFLNLTAPITCLHFSDIINMSDVLLCFIEKKTNNQFFNESLDESVKEIITNITSKCAKLFRGSLLAVSTCSYLNNHMFSGSFDKSRNFTFIYFVPEYLNKPTLVGLIEKEHICKKCEWIRLKELFEKEEDKYYLICLLGNKIKLYEIAKFAMFQNFLYSLKNNENIIKCVENHFIKNNLIKELFTYEHGSINENSNNNIISDFSYAVYVHNKRRFLKVALCLNDTKMKIITFCLSEKNVMNNKMSRMIGNSELINISFEGNANTLDLVFEREECISCEDKNVFIELQNGKYMKEQMSDINLIKFEIKTMETIIALNQGVLSFCSFYPSVNSYLLCVSSNDGTIIIIDIRNGKEIYFMKRKIESISHLRWYKNSCILFGQEKGIIVNLYEQKKTLNIDKSHVIAHDVLCLNSCLLKNHFTFTFDDGSVLIGKLKKSKRSKVHFKDLLLWQTEGETNVDAEFLIKLTCMKLGNQNNNCFSYILLHEYLQGLNTVFEKGVKLLKMQKYGKEGEKTKNPRALSVRSITSAVLEKISLIAYGNASGLVHIFTQINDA